MALRVLYIRLVYGEKWTPFLNICHGIYTSIGSIIKPRVEIDKLIIQYQIMIFKTSSVDWVNLIY